MPKPSHARAPDRLSAADLAACKATLANGSRTFLAASYLLPKTVRDPACALYAFCRVADDAIDAGAATADAALADLRGRLDRIYGVDIDGFDGDPSGRDCATAADRAFRAVAREHAIPRELPEALLEGFAWDAAGRRYETLADLHDYAARVAGTVGAMMALLMGTRSPAALARACDLGVAMQLSNIARDVGEDARAGRVYLPLAWLREAGVDIAAWLAAPAHDARIAAVVQRLLAAAAALYAGVGAGVAELPPSCRVGINAARFLYAEIGREVARRDCNAIDSRAVVSPARKLALLAFAATRRSRRSTHAAPPLPATRHLVAAACAAAPRPPAFDPQRDTQGRVVWLIDLFERLERQDRHRATVGSH